MIYLHMMPDKLKQKPRNISSRARRQPNGGHISTTEHALYEIQDAANGPVPGLVQDSDDMSRPVGIPKDGQRSDEVRDDHGADDTPDVRFNTRPKDQLQPRYLSPVASRDRYTGEDY